MRMSYKHLQSASSTGLAETPSAPFLHRSFHSYAETSHVNAMTMLHVRRLTIVELII